MADTCGTCRFYDELNEEKGKCKIDPAKRNVTHDNLSHETDIINGWPKVNNVEPACNEWKIII